MLFIAPRICVHIGTYHGKARSLALVHVARKRGGGKARKKLLSMVEGIFTPLPNPIMFQFRQMELYARFPARCCSNKDINSLDGKFERQ